MNKNKIFREAARKADDVVSMVMKNYVYGNVHDEDDINAYLAGALDTQFRLDVEGVNWSSSVLRHRGGTAAEEKRIGADLLFYFKIDASGYSVRKGLLVQAKRKIRRQKLSAREKRNLNGQCEKMLDNTPSSFVFHYTGKSLKVGSAVRVLGSNSTNLDDDCTMTSYRFFYDFFRCSIGDRSFTSSKVADLSVKRKVILEASDKI